MRGLWLAVIGVAVVASSLSCSRTNPSSSAGLAEVGLTGEDRVLVLAPHPDDEVIACGGIIQKAVAAKLPLRVVFLTNGDTNEWSFLVYRKHPVITPEGARKMGLVRHDEAESAAQALGAGTDQWSMGNGQLSMGNEGESQVASGKSQVDGNRGKAAVEGKGRDWAGAQKLIFLGYPDFGTQEIWCEHWGTSPAAESMLTRVKEVPYANAFRPGAPYKGEAVLQDLETIMREFRPTQVFVSSPRDQNPDHRSLYLFTRVALWDLDGEGEGGIRPAVHTYLVHSGKWPRPGGYHPEKGMNPPAAMKRACKWETEGLGAGEVARKHEALRRHRSQYEVGKEYLLSFVRKNELFGEPREVALGRGRPAGGVQLEEGEAEPAMPAELTDEERAAFVGIQRRSVELNGEDLTISTTFSRPLCKAVEASVYVFGYKKGCPFGEMPKLQVRFGLAGYEVFDRGKKLPRETVTVTRVGREVRVRMPWAVLGNPEKVFTTTGTSIMGVPLHAGAWVTLEVPRGR